MNKEEALQWEARWARLAAVSAFLAGLLLLAGTFLLQSIFEDRERLEGLPDFLVSVDASPGKLLASQSLLAASALFLMPVFFYLFSAIIHRTPQLPRWFVWLVLIGPIFYAVSLVIGAIDRVDVAHQFVDRAATVGDCPGTSARPATTAPRTCSRTTSARSRSGSASRARWRPRSCS